MPVYQLRTTIHDPEIGDYEVVVNVPGRDLGDALQHADLLQDQYAGQSVGRNGQTVIPAVTISVLSNG